MRLAVFDLDGTLVDSRRDLADSVNLMLSKYGRAPLPADTVTAMVGEGARLLVERAVEVSGLLSINIDEALARFMAIYDERLLVHTRPYGGVEQLLAKLHGQLPMAVLTNKPALASVRVLEGLGLIKYFGAVSGGDGPEPRKPDPAALLALVDRFSADRDSTMMVGDSAIDLRTSRNAGVRCCLVRYGFGFRFAPGELEPGVIVADSPADVARAIMNAE